MTREAERHGVLARFPDISRAPIRVRRSNGYGVDNVTQDMAISNEDNDAAWSSSCSSSLSLPSWLVEVTALAQKSPKEYSESLNNGDFPCNLHKDPSQSLISKHSPPQNAPIGILVNKPPDGQNSLNTTIVLELTLDGTRFIWVNAMWSKATGYDAEMLKGNLVSHYLRQNDMTLLVDATHQMRQEDFASVPIRLAARNASNHGPKFQEMDGKGMIVYNRFDGTPSHTMWVLKLSGPSEPAAEAREEEEVMHPLLFPDELPPRLSRSPLKRRGRLPIIQDETFCNPPDEVGLSPSALERPVAMPTRSPHRAGRIPSRLILPKGRVETLFQRAISSPTGALPQISMPVVALSTTYSSTPSSSDDDYVHVKRRQSLSPPQLTNLGNMMESTFDDRAFADTNRNAQQMVPPPRTSPSGHIRVTSSPSSFATSVDEWESEPDSPGVSSPLYPPNSSETSPDSVDKARDSDKFDLKTTSDGYLRIEPAVRDWPHAVSQLTKQQSATRPSVSSDSELRPSPPPAKRSSRSISRSPKKKSSRSASAASIKSLQSLGWEIPSSFVPADPPTQSSPSNKYDAVDLTDEVEYIGQRPIAVGGYSTVRLGLWRTPSAKWGQQPMKVVIKTLHALNTDQSNETSELKTLKHLLREVRVWQRLHHPNIAPLCGYMWEEQIESTMSASLVSPYHPEGEVADYLSQHPTIDRLQLCRDIAEGLLYLHSFDPIIIHGDLKSSNILVDGRGHAVICDFGLSSLLDMRATGFTSSDLGGTLRYLAPELLADDYPRTTRSDIYAFSCVCIQILHDRSPFAQFRADGPILNAIWKRQPPFDLDVDNDITTIPETFCDPASRTPSKLAAVFEECWSHDPTTRPAINEIVDRLSIERIKCIEEFVTENI